MLIEVLEYVTAAGKVPYRIWLNALKDIHIRARVRTRIDRLVLGNFGDCAPVGRGVSELKINYGPGYRIYFGRAGREVVILLCGGDKRTQQADIELAQSYWEDYKERTK